MGLEKVRPGSLSDYFLDQIGGNFLRSVEESFCETRCGYACSPQSVYSLDQTVEDFLKSVKGSL